MSRGWQNPAILQSRAYTCGHCGKLVGPNIGYLTGSVNNERHFIYLCTYCEKPTYFDNNDTQIPGVPYGNDVSHVPSDIAKLYRETRNCMTVSAYTASVLACRKLLMNLAVDQGAAENQHFIEYVNYLDSQGFVPRTARQWVDHIRKKGNEATHEIQMVTKEDATDLITFTEMLLKIIYEFPQRLP